MHYIVKPGFHMVVLVLRRSLAVESFWVVVWFPFGRMRPVSLGVDVKAEFLNLAPNSQEEWVIAVFSYDFMGSLRSFWAFQNQIELISSPTIQSFWIVGCRFGSFVWFPCGRSRS